MSEELNMSENNSGERNLWIDILRILSSLAVVAIHITAWKLSANEILSVKWDIANFFRSLSGGAVPVFFMISGYLFLDRDISLRVLFGKYVLRLVVILYVWSLIYCMVNRDFSIQHFVLGHYHLWFIFVLIGLYILIPVLSRMANAGYFLVVGFAVAILFPTIVAVMKAFDIPGAELFGEFVNSFNIYMPLGYTFYFVLGGYLKKKELHTKACYVLFLAGVLSTFALTYIATGRKGELSTAFYELNMLNIAVTAVSAFIICSKADLDIGKYKKMIMFISDKTLGIYLIHDIFIKMCSDRGMNGFSAYAVTVIASFICVCVIKKIPILKRIV